MRSFARTLVCLVGTSTIALLPLACSSSSGGGVDGGTFDSSSPPADAGHDVKHDAADAAKDTGAKETGAKDTGAPDAAKDTGAADASDAGSPDATTDAVADGALDAPSDAASDVVDATDAHDAAAPEVDYYFMGRWDTTTSATQPTAEWAGSAVLATFNGTSIAFDVVETANANPADVGGGGFDGLSVVIDSQPAVLFQLNAGFTTGGSCPLLPPATCVPGENVVQITTGLAAGKHTVAIYKTTDPFYGGKVQFKSFIPGGTGAAIEKASYPFARHIEWIGDDINAGRADIYSAATTTACGATPETGQLNAASNESVSYAAVISNFFGAERHNISLATTGVAESLGSAPLLPSVYGYVLPDEPTNAWSFTSWSPSAAAPDLVVVNLGSYGDFANCSATVACPDVGTGATPAAGSYTTGSLNQQIGTAYIAFLGQLRTYYPKAVILVVSGNGYAGSVDPVAASDLVQYVVNQRVATGGEMLGKTIAFYTAATAVEGSSPGDYSCDYYPTSTWQATMLPGTDGLEMQITTLMGW